MATFIGYSTINQNKKFTLTDYELVKRDLLNAFSIRQGELPGRPQYGTLIWNYLFENQTIQTEEAIIAEIRRVASGDPRLNIQQINLFPQENGILVELELLVVPSTNAEMLNIFFNQFNNTVSFK